MQIIYAAAVIATLGMALPACTAGPGDPGESSGAGDEATELSAAAIGIDDSDFTTDTQVVRLPEETASP